MQEYSTIIKMLYTLTVTVIIGLSGSSLYAGYSSAFSLYASKQYDAARTEFLEVVKTEPSNSNAWFYLGEIEKAQKHFDKAVTYYLRAIEGTLRGKNLRSAYWSLMVTTEQQKNYHVMVRACRIYWQKTGDDEPRKRIEKLTNRAIWSKSENAVAAYNDGLALLRSGNKDQAVTAFQRALQADPSFLAPRFELGMLAYGRGDNDGALRDISLVADKVFYYTSAQMAAARLYEEKNRYDRSIIHYSNVIDYGFISQSDRFDALCGRAQSYLRSDKLAEAQRDIETALTLRETQSARLIQVAILIRSKNYIQADQILKLEAAKSPSNPEILYQRGSLHYLQKDPSYFGFFEKLFAIYREKPFREIPVKYQRSFHIIARDYYIKKNYSSAAEIFMKLPDQLMDSNDRINLARSLYHISNYHDAIPRFEKSSLGPDDRMMLIRCYHKTGDSTRAYDMLKPIILATNTSPLDTDPDLGALVTRIRQDEAQRIAAEEKARQEREAAAAAVNSEQQTE